MNTVQNDAFVAIEYTLTLGSGEVVDQSPAGKPLGIIMGNGQIIPGLESALVGRNLGDAFAVDIPAADGYGDVDEEMIQTMPRKNFPNRADLDVGMVFQAQTPHGAVSFRVKKVLEDDVIVDFNHPLAGEKLHFDVKIVEVRETTAEDLQQLHSHACCEGSQGCSGCHG
jgi:FKBP-type peptidyl-prolyl cis-trans isomerase SlyD